MNALDATASEDELDLRLRFANEKTHALAWQCVVALNCGDIAGAQRFAQLAEDSNAQAYQLAMELQSIDDARRAATAGGS